MGTLADTQWVMKVSHWVLHANMGITNVYEAVRC